MTTQRKKIKNNGYNKNNGNNKNNNQPIISKALVAKTPGQTHYLKTIHNSLITICVGPSGTGKTACAIAKGVEYLRAGKFGKIIITRPAVESGESLGFAPGSIKDKFHEYISHTFEEINNWTNEKELNYWISHKLIEYVPLAYTRGRNYNNSYIILEEAQNCTKAQLKLLLTRIGRYSKMVISGDINQTDLPTFKAGGLKFICDNLYDIKHINVVNLTNDDIVRNTIIAEILDRFERND